MPTPRELLTGAVAVYAGVLIAAYLNGFEHATVKIGAMVWIVVCVAIIATARVHPRKPWFVIAAAFSLFALGDVLWAAVELAEDPAVSKVVAAQFTFLCAYAALITGVGLYVRRRFKVNLAEVVLDAAIVATAAWMVLLELTHVPPASGAAPGVLDWVSPLLFPPLDLGAAYLVAIGLYRSKGRDFALWWLLLAALMWFAGDAMYATSSLGVSVGAQVPQYLGIMFSLPYLCAALASLVPQNERRAAREPAAAVSTLLTSRTWISVARFTLITAALLVGPALALTHNSSQELLMVGTLAVTLMVMARIHLLARSRIRTERALVGAAVQDPLTGLLNRRGFIEQLKSRVGETVTIMYIDLDRFKVVNDSLGHAAGDELLRAIADRLRASTREGDTLARLGGDEFVICCADDSDPNGAAERVMNALRCTEVHLQGHLVRPEASVGFSTATIDGESIDTLLSDADLAMYKAKEHGRDRAVAFEAEFRDEVKDRLQLEERLRHAVEQHDLKVLYQPIVDLRSGRIVAFEALSRWFDEDLGAVDPEVFIELAETSGLITKVGRDMLGTAARDLARWRLALGHDDLRMHVNVSYRELHDETFAPTVRNILSTYGLSSDDIVLEITESGLVENEKVVEDNIATLLDLGCEIAIDDFGTGYSSLSYLTRLPVGSIKIDQSFTEGLGRDERDVTVVRSIVGLASSLEINSVAEGIETQQHLDILRDFGCTFGQGYLFSEPVDVEYAEQLLTYPEQFDPASGVMHSFTPAR